MSFLLNLTAAEFFKGAGYVIAALLCLMFMIVVHEFGHYIAGKIFKFKINEFAIGFGPALFKIKNKRNGEIFSVRLLPLGGFCAFAGEDGEAAEDINTEGNFNSKPPWQRIIVLFSGALFNYISAMIIISIFFCAFGEILPSVRGTYDLYADKDMTIVAEQQLQEGDIICKIDGKNMYSLLDSSVFTEAISDKESVDAVIIRNGEKLTITLKKCYYISEATSQEDVAAEAKYGFGISYAFTQHKLSFFGAVGHSFGFGWDVIELIFTSVGKVFTGSAKVSETLGGTATAIASLVEVTQHGFFAVMYAVCVLSASIAIMNILPFPALDGSKIVFCIIEWIRGKPINRKVENIIHVVGLVLLLALAIVLDILHFTG